MMPERLDSEFVDEQVALLNKYGAMALAVRRLEDGLAPAVGTGRDETLIIQAAAPELDQTAVDTITTAAKTATVVVGGRADRLHPAIAKLCGAPLASLASAPRATLTYMVA